MRVKESPKVMPPRKPKGSTGKDALALVESSKARKKMPAKPVKKEKYKKWRNATSFSYRAGFSGTVIVGLTVGSVLIFSSTRSVALP
jgi:hypothetical protein